MSQQTITTGKLKAQIPIESSVIRIGDANNKDQRSGIKVFAHNHDRCSVYYDCDEWGIVKSILLEFEDTTEAFE